MAKGKDSSLLSKLKGLKDSQLDIQGLSTWCLSKGGAKAPKIIATWSRAIKEVDKPKQRVSLFYLANDIIQNAKRKKVKQYVEGWKGVLPGALRVAIGDDLTKDKMARVLGIWEERHVFDKAFIESLMKVFDEKKPVENGGGGGDDEEGFHVDEFSNQADKLAVIQDDVETYRKRYDEYAVSLTEEYIEEMSSKYKDLPAGSEEVKKYHKAVAHLRNYCTTLKKQRSERQKMLNMVGNGLVYYSAQRRDAKVVTKAYHNFGERVKMLQRRVEEKVKTLPEASPVPSPDLDAPSPLASDPGSSPGSVSDDDIRVEAVCVKTPGSSANSFMGVGGKMQKMLEAVKAGMTTTNHRTDEKYNPETAGKKRSDRDRDRSRRRRSRSRSRDRDGSSRSRDRRSRSRDSKSRRSSSHRSKKHKDKKRRSSRSSPVFSPSPSPPPPRPGPPPLDIPLPPSPGRSAAAAEAARRETAASGRASATPFKFYGAPEASLPSRPVSALVPTHLPSLISNDSQTIRDYQPAELPVTDTHPAPSAYFSTPPPHVPRFSVPPVNVASVSPVSIPPAPIAVAVKSVDDGVFVTPETGGNAWNFSSLHGRQDSWASAQSNWIRTSTESSEPEVELLQTNTAEERVPAIPTVAIDVVDTNPQPAWTTQSPPKLKSWTSDLPAWESASQSRQNASESDWYKYNGGNDVVVVDGDNEDDLDFVGVFDKSIEDGDDAANQGNNGDDLYSDLEFSSGRSDRDNQPVAGTSFNNLISLTSEGSDEPRKDFSWMQGSGDVDLRITAPPMLSPNVSSYRPVRHEHSTQPYQTFNYRPRGNVWHGGVVGGGGVGGGGAWRNNGGSWRPRGPRAPGRIWRGYSTS